MKKVLPPHVRQSIEKYKAKITRILVFDSIKSMDDLWKKSSVTLWPDTWSKIENTESQKKFSNIHHLIIEFDLSLIGQDLFQNLCSYSHRYNIYYIIFECLKQQGHTRSFFVDQKLQQHNFVVDRICKLTLRFLFDHDITYNTMIDLFCTFPNTLVTGLFDVVRYNDGATWAPPTNLWDQSCLNPHTFDYLNLQIETKGKSIHKKKLYNFQLLFFEKLKTLLANVVPIKEFSINHTVHTQNIKAYTKCHDQMCIIMSSNTTWKRWWPQHIHMQLITHLFAKDCNEYTICNKVRHSTHQLHFISY